MPETVVEGQLVLQLLRLVNTGVGILPLEGGEASKEEHRDGDTWVESGRVGHSSRLHTVISGQAQRETLSIIIDPSRAWNTPL